MPSFKSVNFVILATSIFACAPALAGDQVVSKLTGYSGNRKCDPGTGGGNQSKGGPKPLDQTWEKGSYAMAAVDPAIWNKMKHCSGTVNGHKIQVEDTCPGCGGEGLKHIDISHTCALSTMTGVIQWDDGCKGIDNKGEHVAIKTKN